MRARVADVPATYLLSVSEQSSLSAPGDPRCALRPELAALSPAVESGGIGGGDPALTAASMPRGWAAASSASLVSSNQPVPFSLTALQGHIRTFHRPYCIAASPTDHPARRRWRFRVACRKRSASERGACLHSDNRGARSAPSQRARSRLQCLRAMSGVESGASHGRHASGVGCSGAAGLVSENQPVPFSLIALQSYRGTHHESYCTAASPADRPARWRKHLSGAPAID